MSEDPAEFADVQWSGRRFVALDFDRLEATDVRLLDCDLSGVVAQHATLRRATARDTRLRDCAFPGGIVQDSRAENCPSDGLSFRFATLQRVEIERCSWPRLDLYGATLDRVTFRDCDLSGAVFDAATVKSASFERCNFAGATGTVALRGAEIDLEDLVTLGPSLARELGIVVR